MSRPTVHRVTPHATDAWLAGRVRPPGPGFEELHRPRLTMAAVAWFALPIVLAVLLIGIIAVMAVEAVADASW